MLTYSKYIDFSLSLETGYATWNQYKEELKQLHIKDIKDLNKNVIDKFGYNFSQPIVLKLKNYDDYFNNIESNNEVAPVIFDKIGSCHDGENSYHIYGVKFDDCENYKEFRLLIVKILKDENISDSYEKKQIPDGFKFTDVFYKESLSERIIQNVDKLHNVARVSYLITNLDSTTFYKNFKLYLEKAISNSFKEDDDKNDDLRLVGNIASSEFALYFLKRSLERKRISLEEFNELVDLEIKCLDKLEEVNGWKIKRSFDL